MSNQRPSDQSRIRKIAGPYKGKLTSFSFVAPAHTTGIVDRQRLML